MGWEWDAGAGAEGLLLFEPVHRRVVGASAAVARLIGLRRDRIRGRLLDDLLEVTDPRLGPPAEVLGRVSEVGSRGGLFHTGRGVFAIRRRERSLPVALCASRARAGASPLGLVALTDGETGSSGLAQWSTVGRVLDRFFALSGELCCVIGLDGCFVKVSPAWEACTGYRPDELEGASLARWVDPGDLTRVRRALRRFDRAGTAAPSRFECRVRHRDGGARRLTWRATFAGGLVYAVAVELPGPTGAGGASQPGGSSSVEARRGVLLAESPRPAVEEPASVHGQGAHALLAGKRPGTRLPARVLVADDHQDNRRLIGLRLGLAGAAVTLAADGLEALEHARAARAEGDPFDLVLLDMQMPVLDGFETVRQLRMEGFATPVVALTAHATSEDCADCLRFGCNGHVSKPIDWNHLLNLLLGLLGDERGTALRVS